MIKELSRSNLVSVIKNGNDQLNNRLVIDQNGTIYLYEVETHHQADPILFNHDLAVINSEHFMPHQDYVGIEAANDKKFIDLEFNRMNHAWQKYLISKTLQYTSDHNY